MTYLDEVEHYSDASLESSKIQLQSERNSAQNVEGKMTTMPRLVNSSFGKLVSEATLIVINNIECKIIDIKMCYLFVLSCCFAIF